MKIIYSRQALADLNLIATYYTTHASPVIAEAIGNRIRHVIDRIGRTPEAAPRVSQRSRIRVAAVIRYPYRIFYRTSDDRIDILHIRHTSRRPSDDIG